MKPLILIPARLASTRLPDKPLADIAGRAMVLRVYDQACSANLGPVFVAAGDQAIADAVEASGGRAVMTDPDLPSGSDRVKAACQLLDPNGEHDVVVNLQGDMPTLSPEALRAVVQVLADAPEADIATLANPTEDPAEIADPNVVKAVLCLPEGGRAGPALYFTRAAAPTGGGPVWHHIGVYAYRRAALERFTALPPSPLERRERLEQLRALEAGMRIHAALVDENPLGVDTLADLEAVRAMFANQQH